MVTETQIVKEMVRDLRKRRRQSKDGTFNYGRYAVGVLAAQELTRGDPDRKYFWPTKAAFKTAVRRLNKRISKKLAQPFRRKRRGPLRRKAAGKNEGI